MAEKQKSRFKMVVNGLGQQWMKFVQGGQKWIQIVQKWVQTFVQMGQKWIQMVQKWIQKIYDRRTKNHMPNILNMKNLQIGMLITVHSYREKNSKRSLGMGEVWFIDAVMLPYINVVPFDTCFDHWNHQIDVRLVNLMVCTEQYAKSVWSQKQLAQYEARKLTHQEIHN